MSRGNHRIRIQKKSIFKSVSKNIAFFENVVIVINTEQHDYYRQENKDYLRFSALEKTRKNANKKYSGSLFDCDPLSKEKILRIFGFIRG